MATEAIFSEEELQKILALKGRISTLINLLGRLMVIPMDAQLQNLPKLSDSVTEIQLVKKEVLDLFNGNKLHDDFLKDLIGHLDDSEMALQEGISEIHKYALVKAARVVNNGPPN